MARDLESFARRNPAIFIGAAFGVGFLVARFLKSTPPNSYSAAAGAAAGKDFVPAVKANGTARKPESTQSSSTPL